MNGRNWILYGLAAALACSFSSLFVKLSQEASISTLVFSRSVLGLPLVLWFIYKKKVSLSWSSVPKNLVRSIAGLCALYAWFYSAQRLPLIHSVVFLNTASLFIPFVLLFYGLLSSKLKFGGAIVGLIGLGLLFFAGTPYPESWNWIGALAGLFIAIAYVSNRKLTLSESPETILGYYFLICPIVSLSPLIIYWEPIDQPIEWLYVFLTGFSALIYQFILTTAYSKASTSKVGILSYLSILFSGLIGWLIFNEIPQSITLLGIIFIVLCALVAFVDHSKPEKI